jgi:hypothetical protein
LRVDVLVGRADTGINGDFHLPPHNKKARDSRTTSFAVSALQPNLGLLVATSLFILEFESLTAQPPLAVFHFPKNVLTKIRGDLL